jgi:NAD(P)-dependent dehydrogenase (short-subunit alcohol dehydrogenase family)
MAPRDLVGTAVFLASADSDFLTGQTQTVDGGATVG